MFVDMPIADSNITGTEYRLFVPHIPAGLFFYVDRNGALYDRWAEDGIIA